MCQQYGMSQTEQVVTACFDMLVYMNSMDWDKLMDMPILVFHEYQMAVKRLKKAMPKLPEQTGGKSFGVK
jgi:hypothetical protein